MLSRMILHSVKACFKAKLPHYSSTDCNRLLRIVIDNAISDLHITDSNTVQNTAIGILSALFGEKCCFIKNNGIPFL